MENALYYSEPPEKPASLRQLQGSTASSDCEHQHDVDVYSRLLTASSAASQQKSARTPAVLAHLAFPVETLKKIDHAESTSKTSKASSTSSSSRRAKNDEAKQGYTHATHAGQQEVDHQVEEGELQAHPSQEVVEKEEKMKHKQDQNTDVVPDTVLEHGNDLDQEAVMLENALQRWKREHVPAPKALYLHNQTHAADAAQPVVPAPGAPAAGTSQEDEQKANNIKDLLEDDVEDDPAIEQAVAAYRDQLRAQAKDNASYARGFADAQAAFLQQQQREMLYKEWRSSSGAAYDPAALAATSVPRTTRPQAHQNRQSQQQLQRTPPGLGGAAESGTVVPDHWVHPHFPAPAAYGYAGKQVNKGGKKGVYNYVAYDGSTNKASGAGKGTRASKGKMKMSLDHNTSMMYGWGKGSTGKDNDNVHMNLNKNNNIPCSSSEVSAQPGMPATTTSTATPTPEVEAGSAQKNEVERLGMADGGERFVVKRPGNVEQHVITSQKYLAGFRVGIPHRHAFQAAHRIIGPGGVNMTTIMGLIMGGKVRVRGEGFQDKDHTRPLQLNISCLSIESYIIAKALVAKLLKQLHDHFVEFTGGAGVPRVVPVSEHPMNPQVPEAFQNDTFALAVEKIVEEVSFVTDCPPVPRTKKQQPVNLNYNYYLNGPAQPNYDHSYWAHPSSDSSSSAQPSDSEFAPW